MAPNAVNAGIQPRGVTGAENGAFRMDTIGIQDGGVRATMERGAFQALGVAPNAVRVRNSRVRS